MQCLPVFSDRGACSPGSFHDHLFDHGNIIPPAPDGGDAVASTNRGTCPIHSTMVVMLSDSPCYCCSATTRSPIEQNDLQERCFRLLAVRLTAASRLLDSWPLLARVRVRMFLGALKGVARRRDCAERGQACSTRRAGLWRPVCRSNWERCSSEEQDSQRVQMTAMLRGYLLRDSQ